MKCPKCGAEANGKFCDKCGALLEKKYDFSQKQTKKINSIEDCLEPDKTATGIISWASGCRTWGLVIAILNVVIGLDSGIIAASAASSVDTDGFSAFISAFLPAVLQGIFIYLAFYAIYLLLSAVGKLVQYNKQTAAFAELQARNDLRNKEEQ